MHLQIDTDEPQELLAEAKRLIKANRVAMAEEKKARKEREAKANAAFDFAKANALFMIERSTQGNLEYIPASDSFVVERLRVDGIYSFFYVDGAEYRFPSEYHNIRAVYMAAKGIVGIVLNNTNADGTPDADYPRNVFAIGVFQDVCTTYQIQNKLADLLSL